MAKRKQQNAKKNQEQNQQLSFWQTIQLGYYGVPDFKRGIAYVIVGIAVVLATYLFDSDNTVNFISMVGGLISFAGFDQISKIIAGIRTATLDDYNQVVIQREITNLKINGKNKKK